MFDIGCFHSRTCGALPPLEYCRRIRDPVDLHQSMANGALYARIVAAKVVIGISIVVFVIACLVALSSYVMRSLLAFG